MRHGFPATPASRAVPQQAAYRPATSGSLTALGAGFVGVVVALGLLSGDTNVGGLLLGSSASAWGSATEVRWLILVLGAPALAVLLTGVAQRRRFVMSRTVATAVALVVAACAYGAASSLWSPTGTALVDQKLWGLLLVGLYTVITGIAMSGPWADTFAKWFWRAVAAVTLLLGVVGLLSLDGTGARVAVLGGGPNVFGRLMGLGIFALLLIGSPHRNRALWASGGVILAVMMVLSGSRGAMVAFGVAGCVSLVLTRPRLRSVLVAIPIAAILGGALYYTGVLDQVGAVAQERLVRLLIEEQYSSGRTPLYTAALMMGLDAPVFGTGLAGFAESGLHTYPHNLFLEAFSEGGVLWLALVMSALGAAVITITRTSTSRSERALRLGLWSYLLVAAMFSGAFYDSRLLFVLPLIGAASVAPASRLRLASSSRS